MWLTIAAFAAGQTLLLAPPPAPPATPTCADVQQIRALAVDEGLATTTLDALERKLCPAVAQRAYDDCFTLWAMTELAHTAGETKLAAATDRARALGCASGGLGPGVHVWPNGVTLRSDDGNYLWPTGLTARSPEGTLFWPTGLTARRHDGLWLYPNGIVARSAEGRWFAPEGTSSRSVQELLITVCGPGACAAELDEIRDWQGEEQVVGLLRILWEAQRSRSARR